MHKLSLSFLGGRLCRSFLNCLWTPLFGTFGSTRVKMTPAIPGKQGSCAVYGRLPRGQVTMDS